MISFFDLFGCNAFATGILVIKTESRLNQLSGGEVGVGQRQRERTNEIKSSISSSTVLFCSWRSFRGRVVDCGDDNKSSVSSSSSVELVPLCFRDRVGDEYDPFGLG